MAQQTPTPPDLRALQWAVVRNDIDQVRMLLQQYQFDTQFMTDVLFHALEHNKLEMLEAVLPVAQVTGPQGCALHSAIFRSNRAATLLILNHHTHSQTPVDVFLQILEQGWDDVVVALLPTSDTKRVLQELDHRIKRNPLPRYTHMKNTLLDCIALKDLENTPKHDAVRKKM